MSNCQPCDEEQKRTAKRAKVKAVKSFGRARIMADKSVVYPKRGSEPPPPLHGYERAPGNDWKFVPLWPECRSRSQVTRFKPCGAIDIVTRCMCADCPLFKAEVRLGDCQACGHRS